MSQGQRRGGGVSLLHLEIALPVFLICISPTLYSSAFSSIFSLYRSSHMDSAVVSFTFLLHSSLLTLIPRFLVNRILTFHTIMFTFPTTSTILIPNQFNVVICYTLGNLLYHLGTCLQEVILPCSVPLQWARFGLLPSDLG